MPSFRSLLVRMFVAAKDERASVVHVNVPSPADVVGPFSNLERELRRLRYINGCRLPAVPALQVNKHLLPFCGLTPYYCVHLFMLSLNMILLVIRLQRLVSSA